MGADWGDRMNYVKYRGPLITEDDLYHPLKRFQDPMVKAASDQLEADLREALGDQVNLPEAEIRQLGYQIIYQGSGLGYRYRGIALGDVLVIDHYPGEPWEPTA